MQNENHENLRIYIRLQKQLVYKLERTSKDMHVKNKNLQGVDS